MTRTLLKKQLLELFAGIYQDKKTGKRRDIKGIIGFGAIYIFLFASLGYIFYELASLMCAPLVGLGFGWLYIALMGIMSVTLGVFGSVFSTFSSLYQAKDNDLLLSMPVPVKKVLFVRLSGVYIMGLLYELIVAVPAMIVYLINIPFNILAVVFCVLIPFILSFFMLSLSCVLGWIVALVSSKIKNQKIITVILSLAFFGGYYYLCGNMSTLIQLILQNPTALGNTVKGVLYPFYQMGLAAQGDIVAMLIFTAIFAGIFAVVYYVLRHSFLKLATTNLGTKKVKYVEKAMRSRSVYRALLGKEFRRFLSSTNYMLNCGLGIVFMVIVAVLLIVNRQMINDLCVLIGNRDFIALFACAATCMISTTNDITAPSVSLEGKSIWLLQVMPVSHWQVLNAKLRMHLILTIVPALILTACIELIIKPSILFMVMMPVIAVLFILLTASCGLVLNLKMPNLNWTSEIVPIKQSAGVMLTLFGGWVVIIALGVVYYFVSEILTPTVFILCVAAFLLAVNVILLRWLKYRGSKIFANLH